MYPVEVTVNYVNYEGREYNCAFARDISTRRKAEESLRQSEERFRRVFEQGSVGIALLDPDQRLVRANPAFCQMLGCEEDELLGKSMAEVTAKEDVKRSLEDVRALYEGSQPVISMEKRYLRKDGEIVWASLHATLLRDKDGKPTGSAAMVRDITEDRRAAEALRLTRFSLDRAADCVHWIDSGGRILDVNESSCHKYGYSREEMLALAV